ncbi:MAG TPA: RES family NAD+ phosphorylase [Opitutaceae bacterium]
MITAWRICAAARTATAFDGHSAAKYPGRWNPSGVRAVYAAENRSLAALEVLVHAEDKELLVAARWSIISVRFDPSLVSTPSRFPPNWQKVPAPETTRKFGGDWVAKGASAVLRVPSVVTLGESCYILNPLHPDFPKVEVGEAEPFSFDGRSA